MHAILNVDQLRLLSLLLGVASLFRSALDGFLDAVAHVLVEERDPDRAECRVHGVHLRQHVDAVRLVFDHPLQTAHLPLDATEPIAEFVAAVLVPRRGRGGLLRRHVPSIPPGGICVFARERARDVGPHGTDRTPGIESPSSGHAGWCEPRSARGPRPLPRRPPRDVRRDAHGPTRRRGVVPTEPTGEGPLRRPGVRTRGVPGGDRVAASTWGRLVVPLLPGPRRRARRGDDALRDLPRALREGRRPRVGRSPDARALGLEVAQRRVALVAHLDLVARRDYAALIAEWPSIVGKALAESSLPEKLSRSRQNDSGVMGFVTEGLTPLEMRAVAAYIGQMQPVASSAKAKKK